MSLAIVIPTYDRPTLLKAWLAAIIQQQPDEIIVVNDSPTVSLDIPQDIKYIQNQVNLGVTASNYVGLQAVTADYVMFCADDDSLRPDAIANLKASIKNYPDAGFIAGRSMWHNRARGIQWVSGRSMAPGYYTDISILSDGRLRIPGEAAVYNVKLIRQGNLYRPELKLFADLYMTWSLAFNHPFVVLPDIITDFYLNPAGHYARTKSQAVVNDEAHRMIGFFEASNAENIRKNGIIGFTDVDSEFIKINHPAWDTPAFRGHCLLRKFERLAHRWTPGWIVNMLGKYYK